MTLPAFGNRPVGSVRTSEVRQWLASLDRADNTRAKALQILRSVLEVARQDRGIVTNPAADVRPPTAAPERDGVVLTDAEVERVLDAAETVDEPTAPLVWLMVRTGLRIGEAIALRRSDIDFDAGTLTVARSMNRRGEVVAVKGRRRESEGRTLPMPTDLSDRLRRHLEATPPRLDGLLVTGPRGAPIRYTNWRRRRWLPICERAEV